MLCLGMTQSLDFAVLACCNITFRLVVCCLLVSHYNSSGRSTQIVYLNIQQQKQKMNILCKSVKVSAVEKYLYIKFVLLLVLLFFTLLLSNTILKITDSLCAFNFRKYYFLNLSCFDLPT